MVDRVRPGPGVFTCQGAPVLCAQETLTELQRRDPNWAVNKGRYLEDTSAAGVTPLILAAQRGNLQCVEAVRNGGYFV